MKEEAVECLDRSLCVGISDRVVAALIVRFIAHDRVIDRREMNSDLMRPTGLDVDIEKSKFLETLTHFPDRQRDSTASRDCHLGPMPAIASDRPVDSAAVVTRTSVNKCDIRFGNCPAAKLLGERLVSLLVFRDDDEP